jgi:hypothetical protein|tara:strand:+ start:480 stop:824 length:345 start_codon:yes stop_codon:yes gene_type:complete
MTKALYSKPEDVQVMVDLYFADAQAAEDPVSIAGLAYALGFSSRQSLYEYEAKELYADTIKKARLRVEAYMVKRSIKSNGAGAIFQLKNMGYTDRQVVQIEPVRLVIAGRDSEL